MILSRITPRISGATLLRPTTCDCNVAAEHSLSITSAKVKWTLDLLSGDDFHYLLVVDMQPKE